MYYKESRNASHCVSLKTMKLFDIRAYKRKLAFLIGAFFLCVFKEIKNRPHSEKLWRIQINFRRFWEKRLLFKCQGERKVKNISQNGKTCFRAYVAFKYLKRKEALDFFRVWPHALAQLSNSVYRSCSF